MEFIDQVKKKLESIANNESNLKRNDLLQQSNTLSVKLSDLENQKAESMDSADYNGAIELEKQIQAVKADKSAMQNIIKISAVKPRFQKEEVESLYNEIVSYYDKNDSEYKLELAKLMDKVTKLFGYGDEIREEEEAILRYMEKETCIDQPITSRSWYRYPAYYEDKRAIEEICYRVNERINK